jgi:hypothetical protein
MFPPGHLDPVKVSEALPFLEYELQRQLVLKLKVLGMNAAFAFESQVCRVPHGNSTRSSLQLCSSLNF